MIAIGSSSWSSHIIVIGRVLGGCAVQQGSSEGTVIGQQSNGACHAIAMRLILIQKNVRPSSFETPHGQHFV